MNKKCIVLDLDNTLWGGVIGEDGLEGIELGLTGRGASFLAFQQALLDLYNKGILLAINSRNNKEDALKVLREHPNMILKEKHFAAVRANWNDKASNIVELAKELNIGTDSLVFIDDDPANRAFVKQALPEVVVPDFPGTSEGLVSFLVSMPYFDLKNITDEDKMRGNLYVTERLRKEMEKGFVDKKDFLKGLNIEMHIHTNDQNSIARLSQLTEKTNQFNFNKNPLEETEVAKLMDDQNHLVLHGRVVDMFGDHGITNLAIIKKEGDVWRVVQYLMSCRVIGKNIEEAFTSSIAELAKREGIRKIEFVFNKTEKNIPAQDFIRRMGGRLVHSVSEIVAPENVKIIIN